MSTANIVSSSDDLKLSLENLDNVKLRAKCLEYGLPNVPITDTSRKVLIKKLVATMTETQNDKNIKKNKRETISGTKIPVLVDVAAVKSVSNKEENNASNRSLSKRSIVTSSNLVEKVSQISTTSKLSPKEKRQNDAELTNARRNNEVDKTIIIEDDEDDLILAEAADSTEKIVKSNIVLRDRKSRSASLSKTGIVTTSYSQKMEKICPTITVNDVEMSETYSPNLYKLPTDYRPAVEVNVNIGESVQCPIGFEKTSDLMHSQRPIGFEKLNSGYTSTNTFQRNLRKSEEPETYKNAFSSRYSTFERPSTPVSNTASIASRRYTSASIPKYDALYNEQSDEYDDDGIGTKTIDSPYLSSFARRLERLKVDQINSGISLKAKNLKSRRCINSKESITESFFNFCHVIENQYHLKKIFAILFAFICVTFIYFIFIR